MEASTAARVGGRLRVALVGPFPLDAGAVGGGVESSFASLVVGLRRLGDVEPVVVTFREERETPELVDVGGVETHVLPAPARWNLTTLYHARRSALETALRGIAPDVVHGQEALGHGFTCLHARQPAPVVLSVHGIVREEQRYAENLRDRAQLRVGAAIERHCVRRARFLVQPTRYPERVLGKDVRGRIFDVGNPIADRFFEEAPDPVPGRILCVGAIIPRKRLLDLVEALPRIAERCPAAHVRVAGGADPTYLAHVQSRMAALGVGDRIEILGLLGRDALLAEYRGAGVLALPSGQETSPMAIGEAMAMGIPVVATRVGGVADLMETGVTGEVVEVADVSALADAVGRLLTDTAIAAEMRAAARLRAEERFRPEAVAARVREVYRLALADAGHGTAATG